MSKIWLAMAIMMLLCSLNINHVECSRNLRAINGGGDGESGSSSIESRPEGYWVSWDGSSRDNINIILRRLGVKLASGPSRRGAGH
ncbi:hypothetical protein BVRB_1g015510 [Beta vulgaris subsp. vulgaris]|nr:hypothetical protein BVRB_1g015510 [Beta vulgaris subsp. vulgaris]